MEEKQNSVITKRDLRRVFLNSLTIMCSWNYERQMHMGFMFGMAPIIDKLYKNDEKRKKEAYQRHMWFFNCTPQMTSFIMGLAASMEEQNAKSKEGEFQPESISMIKTSLMGPFAGIEMCIRDRCMYKVWRWKIIGWKRLFHKQVLCKNLYRYRKISYFA